MPRTIVCDPFGVPRLVKRWAVCDSSGVTRMIKRAFVGDASGVARLVFQPSVVFSIVAGQIDTLIGYYSGQFGSIAGAGLPTGQTIYAVWEDVIIPAGTVTGGVIISGFSSNPGSAFFKSLAVNGLTLNTSAATYTYGVAGPGWAEWQWSGGFGLFVSGTTYPCQLN